jgi:hypothetical protein
LIYEGEEMVLKILSGLAAMGVWIFLIMTQFYYAPNYSTMISPEAMPLENQHQMMMDMLKHCP